MTLAKDLNLPERPREARKWTRSSAFPIAAAIKSAAKRFDNTLDALSLASVFGTILLEAFGRHPWGLYAIAVLSICLSFKSKQITIEKQE